MEETGQDRDGLRLFPYAVPEPDLRLYALQLDAGRDVEVSADLALLSPDEAVRADRFRFARDRRRFVRARAFLRRVLAAETGHAADEGAAAALVFRYGPRGKPELAGGPAFNLSHSGESAVLAVSGQGAVGIDIEETGRAVDALDLAEAVFTPAERGVLAALPAEARAARFFAFWTAKEARMKLTGEGMALAPQRIALALDADGCPAGFLRPARPAARLLPAPAPWPGLALALVYAGTETA